MAEHEQSHRNTVEQEPQREQYGVPQELINRLWVANNPETDRQAIYPLPEVFLALAAHEKGLTADQVGVGQGRWKSYRLQTNIGPVDVVCEPPDDQSDASGKVHVTIDSQQHAGGLPEPAAFWNAKYTLQADPAFVAEKMAQRQEQRAAADRAEAERGQRFQAAMALAVSLLRDHLSDKLKASTSPAIAECLRTLLDDDTADLSQFAISLTHSYPVNETIHDDTQQIWTVNIWQDGPKGPAIYNILEYSP